MISQARPSHSFSSGFPLNSYSERLAFQVFGTEGRGLRTFIIGPRPVAYFILLPFELYHLLLSRNIHISNCLPEWSLVFHASVRYYSPNFNRLLSFSFLVEGWGLEISFWNDTECGLNSSHWLYSVTLVKLLLRLMRLNFLICKVRMVITPF